jgi:predicted esterase
MIHALRRLVAVILVWTSASSPGALAQEDVADVPCERVTLAEKQVYFLAGNVGANHDGDSAKPRPLVLILPGGDGGEAFKPFVLRIVKNVLPPDAVVAQLVAVPSEKLKQIVWPTSKAPDAKQKFTTESFIEAVVADVRKRANIDRKRVMALGWSSSGPALYASAATKGSPVKGYFIAMSVFRPADLPEPKEVKSKRFYLLHSPDDKVCPYRMAQQARTKLAELGAPVTLADYADGHGWHGDVFGMIRTGIEWLEKPKDK